MTEKAIKRPRRKKNEPTQELSNSETVESATQNAVVWISAAELKKVLEIMAMADGLTIQQVVDRMNAKINAKELMIFPQFPKVVVRA